MMIMAMTNTRPYIRRSMTISDVTIYIEIYGILFYFLKKVSILNNSSCVRALS
jgi:hypothetical protein